MGALGFFPLMILVIVGVPIAFALGVVGFVGLGLTLNWTVAVAQLKCLVYEATASYTIAVIPLFVLMGNFAVISGISSELYESATKWFGKFPGGLAISTTVAAALFGACSGSTMASASIFTKISLPEMAKYKYDNRLSCGAICSAGALACMIPPSLLMILYGIIVAESIGKLLIAGILPGILTVGVYIIGIFVVVKLRPAWAPRIPQKFSLKDKLYSLKKIYSISALFVLVIGGIYLGWFTPSQGGAIGAFGAFIIALIRRKLTRKLLWGALLESGILTTALLVIIIFGTLFSYLISTSGVIDLFAAFINELAVPRFVILLMFLMVYLVLGCMIDPVSMLIITLPVLYPVFMKLGYDSIWFGIIVISMLEIAVVTPPLGMNMYAVKAAGGDNVELGEIFSGVGIFLIMNLVVLAALIIFPSICTFLPNLM